MTLPRSQLGTLRGRKTGALSSPVPLIPLATSETRRDPGAAGDIIANLNPNSLEVLIAAWSNARLLWLGWATGAVRAPDNYSPALAFEPASQVQVAALCNPPIVSLAKNLSPAGSAW